MECRLRIRESTILKKKQPGKQSEVFTERDRKYAMNTEMKAAIEARRGADRTGASTLDSKMMEAAVLNKVMEKGYKITTDKK